MRTTFKDAMILSLALGWCGCCASFPTSALYAQAAPKAGRCYLLAIEGMTCQECATHVQKALANVPGVAEAKVNYAKAEASVCAKQGVNVASETLVKVVEKAGYKAKVKRQS